MKKNANYTWLICQECKKQTKIIPGQQFTSKEEWANLFDCDCKPVAKTVTRRKVVKNDA